MQSSYDNVDVYICIILCLTGLHFTDFTALQHVFIVIEIVFAAKDENACQQE